VEEAVTRVDRVEALAQEWQREIDSIAGPRWDRRTTGGRRGALLERMLSELRAALADPPRTICGCSNPYPPPHACYDVAAPTREVKP
jgi:hypothetical protein